MRIKIDDELKAIAQKILNMDRTEEEWTEDESWDHFQSETICGGYDACERMFTFGRYRDGNEIYTVQFTYDDVPLITRGIMQAIEAQEVEAD